MEWSGTESKHPSGTSHSTLASCLPLRCFDCVPFRCAALHSAQHDSPVELCRDRSDGARLQPAKRCGAPGTFKVIDFRPVWPYHGSRASLGGAVGVVETDSNMADLGHVNGTGGETMIESSVVVRLRAPFAVAGGLGIGAPFGVAPCRGLSSGGDH